MNQRYQQRVAVFCTVALSIVAFAGSAETETGSVVGVVRGPGGVTLSLATVIVTDQSGHSPVAVVTGEGGEFKITGLAPLSESRL